MTYSSYEPGARLHGAEPGVPYLQGQDLGSGGHPVPLWVVRETAGGDAGYVGTVSSCQI